MKMKLLALLITVLLMGLGGMIAYSVSVAEIRRELTAQKDAEVNKYRMWFYSQMDPVIKMCNTAARTSAKAANNVNQITKDFSNSLEALENEVTK